MPLHSLITDHDDIEQALRLLIDHLKSTGHRQLDLARNLNGQLVRLNNSVNQGILSSEQMNLQRNSLRVRVNSLISDLERDGVDLASIEVDEPKPAPVPAGTDPAAGKQAASKTRILFLQANPNETARLRVQAEYRDVKAGLRGSKNRDGIDLESEWAVTTTTLRRALLDHEPNIIHFSGHGEQEGIFLERDSGEAWMVDRNYLSGLFELFKESLQCVVLNACWSEAQAEAIARHIPYVIGMRTAVPDAAAIQFSIGFYDAIGDGKDVEFAFKLGKLSIEGENLEGADVPQLVRQKDILDERGT